MCLKMSQTAVSNAGGAETDSIATLHPRNGRLQIYLRERRIDWAEPFSVAGKYLNLTKNQLSRSLSQQSHVDMRFKLYAL